MAKRGYIKLYRAIKDNFLWKDKPFTKGQAWIDILLAANHSDGGFFKRGVWIDVKRGQDGRSELTLADEWGWSRGKVRRFLATLKNEGMIIPKQDNKTTIITICNYELFQPLKINSDTTSSTAGDTPNGHQTDTKRYTNNNVKECKEEEKELIVSVVDYLNQKIGSKYKPSTEKTKSCINARINEGYNLDDFKTVIDKKYGQWINTDQSKYLRPETLFGNKFEGYLNEININNENKSTLLTIDGFTNAIKWKKQNPGKEFKCKYLKSTLREYVNLLDYEYNSIQFKQAYKHYHDKSINN